MMYISYCYKVEVAKLGWLSKVNLSVKPQYRLATNGIPAVKMCIKPIDKKITGTIIQSSFAG